MNRGRLPFSAKYLGSAVLWALREAGIACRPVDVRVIDQGGLPATQSMPALVVFSGGFGDKSIVAAVRGYGEKGGRVLLVGGEHGGVLGELSQCLAKAEDVRFPVSRKYGQNNTDYIERLRVRFLGDLAKETGCEPLPFVHNPDTKAGWQKPWCGYVLSAQRPNVRALAKLVDGDRCVGIGGVLVGGDGKVRSAFVPEYLLSPYLLTNLPPLVDPSRPTLDELGRKVLLHVVRGMMP